MTEEIDWQAEAERIRRGSRGHEALKRHDEEQRRADNRQRWKVLERWGVPRRVRTNLLDLDAETDCMREVRRWMAMGADAWCLVLSGQKGCGKSTAAGYWLWSLARGMRADSAVEQKWWTAAQIATLDAFDKAKPLQRLGRQGGLVLDDMGVEYLDRNGAFEFKLDGFIDERYGNLRKTIITTNLGVREFGERYSERVVDRIREGGVFYETSAPSMRSAG